METNCWNGTSYEILDNEINKELLSFLKEQNVELEKVDGKCILYQSEKMIFNISDYLETKSYFSEVVDYFREIDFSTDLDYIYFEKEWKNEKINFSEEVKKYNEIIENNNIKNDYKNFSINLLKQIDNPSDKIKYIIKIFILLFLSTNTDIKDNNFDFQIRDMNGVLEVSEKYSYNRDTDFSSLTSDIEVLIELYNWIISDYGYSNTFKQRLDIVRCIFIKSKNFKVDTNLIKKSESIFKRIVSQETDKYFKDVTQLKNDFLKITERENDIYQSLHVKLIGWFSALAIVIFNKIKDYKGNDVFIRLLTSNTQKTKLLLSLLVCALVFILFIYVIEIRKNQEEYFNLKLFYTKSLMFDGGDFENKVNFPYIDCRYVSFVFVTVLVLLIRICFSGTLFVCCVSILTIFCIVLSFSIKDNIANICKVLNKKEESEIE
ncbi:hypothetical protein [Streptococcus salivarius]